MNTYIYADLSPEDLEIVYKYTYICIPVYMDTDICVDLRTQILVYVQT